VDVAGRVATTGLLAEGGAGRGFIVLLSGGRDSTCLLDVAVRLAGPAAVTALHVNYGLRGAQSDGDQHRCAELCAALGVTLDVHSTSRPAQDAGNLQAWAREVRYAAGAQAAAASGARLLSGHTLSDQVETILYRLAASPGRRALLGMDVETTPSVRPPAQVIRPLLAAEVTREETTAWCTEHGLAWRDDASNADPAYARTRVREGLLPALRAVDARAERNVLRTAALLRDEGLALDAIVQDVLGGHQHLEVARLRELPRGLARLVLRRLAEDATGRLCGRAASRLDDVLALDRGALDLGDGARATVSEGVLRVVCTPGLGRTDSC
jgi:tRNA(Ile)-lysidine synthase